MQCKLDKYDLITKTIGSNLNKGIQSMLQNDCKNPKVIKLYLKTATEEEDKERTKFFMIPENDEDIFAISSIHALICTVPLIKVRIIITGNLAFYLIILGKPSMDLKWCSWCNAAYKEWSKIDEVRGELWSLQICVQKLFNIQNNPNMSIYNKKGVKFTPILQVDPTLFVPPPLHIKLCLFNRAFTKPNRKSYFSWSQIRIENIPNTERIVFHLFQ